MAMCASLDIHPIKEEWRSVEEMFGDLYVLIILAHMMLMLSVECLATAMVR